MRQSGNAYKSLVGNPVGKKLDGRPRCRWEDNIKIDYKEMGFGSVG
jgi:hypothetical protein